MPGVLAIYTAADLTAGGIGRMPFGLTTAKHSDGSEAPRPEQMALAHDRVRYVGDPIALVVAESLGEARDAAESVHARHRPAARRHHRRRRRRAGRAAAARRRAGQRGAVLPQRRPAAVAAAFAGAAHVTRLDLDNSRIVVCAMEPRSAPPSSMPQAAATPCASARRACSGCAHRGRRAGRAQGAGARADRQRRRLVRHEGDRATPSTSPCCMRPRRSDAR